MSATMLRLDGVPRQPWRNGAGTTRELLARPSDGEWRVRLSVADVERDGAFSSYPGVRRWFAVLKGAGVELAFDGHDVKRLTRRDEPLAFDGAAAVHCRLLDGPTLDLNLMLRGVPGRLLAAADSTPWRPGGASCGLFTAVAGLCAGHAVPAYALLWFERAPPELLFEAAQRPAAATGWWIEVDACRH